MSTTPDDHSPQMAHLPPVPQAVMSDGTLRQELDRVHRVLEKTRNELATKERELDARKALNKEMIREVIDEFMTAPL